MSTTLLLYRRALSQELGRYAVTTATALANTFDGLRQVISTYFRNDMGSPHAYDGGWVYLPINAGTDDVSRRVLDAGFHGVAGLLRMDRPFANPVASGTTIEFHERFPGITTEGVIGLRELINLALRDTWVPGVLSIATSGASTYALPTWLDDDWYIEDVLDPPLFSGTFARSRKLPWGLRFDEDAPALELRPPVATGYVVGVAVRRPGDSWINGAESTVGLAADADTALPPSSTVATIGALYAYRWLVAEGKATDTDKAQLAIREEQAKSLPRYWPRQHLGLSPYASAAKAAV